MKVSPHTCSGYAHTHTHTHTSMCGTKLQLHRTFQTWTGQGCSLKKLQQTQFMRQLLCLPGSYSILYMYSTLHPFGAPEATLLIGSETDALRERVWLSHAGGGGASTGSSASQTSSSSRGTIPVRSSWKVCIWISVIHSNVLIQFKLCESTQAD